MIEKQYVTAGVAARMLGVSTSTLYKWGKAGRLKMIRTIGGHRRVSLAEIQRLCKEDDGHG